MYSRKGMNPNEYRTDDAEEVLVLRAEIERLEDALSNAQQEIARSEDDHERLTLKGVNND